MKLLDALNNVTEDDLKESEAKIATLENELKSLRELQRVIRARLGMPQCPSSNLNIGKARAKQARDAANTTEAPASFNIDLTPDGTPITAKDRYRQAAYRYIMANGPCAPATLVKYCDIPSGSITAVLDHKWFRKTSRGVELAD